MNFGFAILQSLISPKDLQCNNH